MLSDELIRRKGAYAGQRCFIVASGPSMKEIDVSRLKSEVTICVNQSYKILPFGPTFQCIGDRFLWPKIKETYAQMAGTWVFCTSGMDGSCGSDYPGKNMLGVAKMHPSKDVASAGFSWDLAAGVNKALTVVLEAALPLACWLGFDDVYILGCDCTANGYAYDNPALGLHEQKIQPRTMEMFEEVARTPLPCRVWNAGVGGKLDCFHRIDYKELFPEPTPPEKLLVVGYYTPDLDYRLRAEAMKASVEKQGLTCVIKERASWAEPDMPKPMPWVMNCAQCGPFIKDMMKEYPDHNILYLDADATMVRRPKLFLDEPIDYAFAAPFLTNEFTRDELQSNTLYFHNCEAAVVLLDAWIEEQHRRLDMMLEGRYKCPYREAWDQRVLKDVLEELPFVSTLQLPMTYGKIDDKPDGVQIMKGIDPYDVVIAQHQASRKNQTRI